MHLKFKTELKRTKEKIINVLQNIDHLFNPKSVIDKNLKIIIFIVYFINWIRKNETINQTINTLGKTQIFITYIKALRDLPNIKLFAKKILNPMKAYFIKNNIEMNSIALSSLLISVTNLLLINYKFSSFRKSATKNLAQNNYQSEVQLTLLQCRFVANIHEIISEISPLNINKLSILINLLMKPLTK